MNPVLAWLRRNILLVVLLGLMAHFAFASYVNSGRLTEVCEAFSAGDPLVDRAIPADSPWRSDIDERRQAIARLCATHLSEQVYPEKRDYRNR